MGQFMHSHSLKTFSYVNAEKAPIYRNIMATFMEAKSQFCLHLRPSEIAAALGPEGLSPFERSDLDAALTQLCEWGNLEANSDTSEVSTVEDFYRPRYLYQLTVEGEATERALLFFNELIRQPGELQSAALSDIRSLLTELYQLMGQETSDNGKIHLVFKTLCVRFDELTSKAQIFMASLQRTIELHGISVAAFLAYKNTLIDYLERFIGQLIIATAEITDVILQIELSTRDELIECVVRQDLVDRISLNEHEFSDAVIFWKRKWEGLRAWFLSQPGKQSQAEILRARARSSIPALLAAASSLNERRAARSDRVTDLRMLARWFAEASPKETHRLARAAFGLSPSRHLSIDATTMASRDDAPISAQTSWLNAPPLMLSLRLRKTGYYQRRGRPNTVIDRSHEKALLARLAAEESAEIEVARKYFKSGSRFRLSQLTKMNAREFQLFLELLGAALSRKLRSSDVAEAFSADGRLKITLESVGDSSTNSPPVTIQTTYGTFSGNDYFITVTDVLAPQAIVGQGNTATREMHGQEISSEIA
jgi:uncharacterized protein (TIGR02677 family)